MRETIPKQSSGMHALLRLQAPLVALAVFMLVAFGAGMAQAAMPPANATIGNQATATYDDPTYGAGRVVPSNIVTTKVQQVYSLTLVQPLSLPAAAGQLVNYLVTLQNTGNGSDTFNLSSLSLTDTNSIVQGSTITLYTDGGGGPSSTVISGPVTIAAGASYSFYATIQLKNTALTSQTAAFDIKAQSTGTGTPFQTVHDVVTATGNAVIGLVKSVSPGSGNPNTGPYTYTLTFSNTGPVAGSAIQLSDIIPPGLTYVNDSSKFNGVAFNDGALTPGITAQAWSGAVTHTYTATIASLAAGGTAILTFKVNIDAAALAGSISNTATFDYNNGAGVVVGAPSTVGLTVNTTTGVKIGDSKWDRIGNVADTSVVSTTDADVHTNDTVLIATANQGQTVWFDNVLTNTGNNADTFTFTYATSLNLGGSPSVGFYDAQNGIQIAAPVALAAGATYHVWTKLVLPMGATGAGPFNVVVTARSTNGGNTDLTTDQITTVNPSQVDLTNDKSVPAATAGSFPGNGKGAGFEAAYVVQKAVTSGAAPVTTAPIVLYVNNTGSVTDSFDLTYGSANTGIGGLPAGWSVTFYPATGAVGSECTTYGASYTTVPSIAAGASAAVCAIVTVPANASPTALTGQDVYIKANSPLTGTSDVVHDAVLVNTIRNLTLLPANQGNDVVIGAFRDYTLTIRNNGNVTEGLSAALVTLATGGDLVNWSSTVQPAASSDLNTLAGGGLLPGTSITVTIRVFANTNVLAGVTNVTTVTLHGIGTINGVNPSADVNAILNTLSKISSGVSVLKEQALDANCDGAPDTGYGTVANLPVLPGQCIAYRITVTNNNPWAVTNMTITDALPQDDSASHNTMLYNTGVSCYDASWNLLSPAYGATRAAITGGTGVSVTTEANNCTTSSGLAFHINQLDPTLSSVITFGVQVPH